ncbi:hypothetical protein C8R44DRAFT_726045 [Mycena epipterygia]|nr:hypothetical protein C8R44DRAFT_726045 [Mycena epipterygia]
MSSESLKPAPTLPPELERHIFEIAAFIHPKSMSALVQVAQRAQIWVEPLLYRVLCIGSRPGHIPVETIRRLMDSRPPSFFHDHVRHVSVDLAPDQMDDILRLFTLCDATVNVLLFQRCPDLLPRVGVLPLQRLSAFALYLCAGHTGPDLSHPAFKTITHLDLYGVAGVDAGDRRGWEIWSRLAEMPCLTHLSVQNRAFAGNLYYGALRDCKSLEALAVIFSNANILEAFVASYAALATDPRLVMLVVMNRPRDWEMGAKGDEDSWVRVDELVRRRRSGETKEYFIIEDPSPYPRTT